MYYYSISLICFNLSHTGLKSKSTLYVYTLDRCRLQNRRPPHFLLTKNSCSVCQDHSDNLHQVPLSSILKLGCKAQGAPCMSSCTACCTCWYTELLAACGLPHKLFEFWGFSFVSWFIFRWLNVVRMVYLYIANNHKQCQLFTCTFHKCCAISFWQENHTGN